MVYETVLLVFRLAFHVVTALVIAFYMGNPTRQRHVIAFTAACLAGSSAALAAQILTQWDDLLQGPIQPWLVILTGAICFLVVHARGNVAELFHRRWGRG